MCRAAPPAASTAWRIPRARARTRIERKLAAVWDYQTSPLFSAAERAALDFTIAASAVPNAVTDDMFLEMRKFWTEDQIVEIVG